MAQIEKRGNRYRVRIRRKGLPDLSQSFTDRDTAEKWARKTESELERGIYLEDIEDARSTSIKDAAAQFAKEHLSRLRHGLREKNRLAAILDRTKWETLSLTALKAKDVAEYVRNREDVGCKPDTIRLDLALISKLYKHARQEWGMESLRNPVDAVRRPSLRGTARSRRLEDGEEEKLLKAAHDDLKPAILFALETAMRREEIASLAWPEISLKKRTAHLPRTKNGDARTVPLSRRAVAILRLQRRKLGSKGKGIVFGLTKDQITDRMRVTVARAGLSDLRFHDLRHEATTRLFERGDFDMMEIASITGHKTLSMLRRYTHLRAENLARKLG